MKAPRNFPVSVRCGSVTVKIYRHENKGYTNYMISYSVAGKRKQHVFADYEAAYREADSTAKRIAKGELQVLQLSSAERSSYGHAKAALEETKVPLELAAREYAEAHKLLGGKASVIEAVKFYVRRHENCQAKDVTEAVEEMYASKAKEGASEAYMRVLRCYLGKFAKAFKGAIGGIETDELGDFLREMKLSNRSKKNARGVLSAFFRFCRERNWLPRDQDLMENVPSFKPKMKDAEIYTPEELAQLLSHARSEMIPYLTIAAFAGVRSAELQRLDWRDIDLEAGFITVRASNAKTGSRRVVPISTNLKAWLMHHAQKEGKVVAFENVPKQLGWVARDAGLKWKKNALRHSFCSYRLAQTQDAAKVSLEAGNSPQIIFRHYHELVRPVQAERWFAIETTWGRPGTVEQEEKWKPRKRVPPLRRKSAPKLVPTEETKLAA